MGCFLGFDASTQSLSAVVVDTDGDQVVLNASLRYGDALPRYEAPDGFIPSSDPLVRHADPRMWVDALETLLARCASDGFDLGRIDGIAGSAQQHGSVYLRDARAFPDRREGGAPLRDAVGAALSRPTAPIWMDGSTRAQCEAIARAAGGDERVLDISGSRATERFTGPQVRRFAEREPDGYAATGAVLLVSSFMASLLCGERVAIDHGDGAGMNLLDLASGDWSATLLDATAERLGERLGRPVPSSAVVGELASGWGEFGLRPGTPVVAWSGDNPCSLIGMGAYAPGTVVLSLGTSDTLFAAIEGPRHDPRGLGHVFGNPAGGFMGISVFENGSLARDAVRERVGLDWDGFAAGILEESEPGNDGNLMLPYFAAEITPRIHSPEVVLAGDARFEAWERPAAAARAVVEAQALAMRRYAGWVVGDADLVLATGGAAANPGVLQVFADVLGARVRRLELGNSAALGAALRAANTCGGIGFDALAERFARPGGAVEHAPDAAAAPVYEELEERLASELQVRFGV